MCEACEPDWPSDAELRRERDSEYADRLDAVLTGSASPDDATWPGYWEAKRLVLAELGRTSSGAWPEGSDK